MAELRFCLDESAGDQIADVIVGQPAVDVLAVAAALDQQLGVQQA